MLPRLLTRLRLGPSPYKTSKFAVGLDSAVPPLYQRVPSFWARWAWALIACDVFMAGSAIELTWNHWTTVSHDDRPEPENPNEALIPPRIPDDHGLRPTWQRLSLCSVHLAIGTGVGVFLAIAQSRYVRMLSIIPPPLKAAVTPGGKPATLANAASHAAATNPGNTARVFIQCAHNWKKNGLAFPLDRCTFKQGRDHSEITMRVRGERGHWFLPLDDAWVNGQKQQSIWLSREILLKDWSRFGGKKIGSWATPSRRDLDGRWKSGPAAQRMV